MRDLELDATPRTEASRFWVILLVAALAVLAGFLARRVLEPGVPATEDARSSMPETQQLEFELEALDGARVSHRDFSGRVLVVDFWATWCGPCKVQAGILEALQERYPTDAVSFVAINVGEPEDLVRGFLEADPLPYPVLMDPSQSLSARYGIYALPTVMVVDREQGIVFRNMGVSSGNQVSSVIDRTLGTG